MSQFAETCQEPTQTAASRSPRTRNPLSNHARFQFASRFRRALLRRCGGDLDDREALLVVEMLETAWQRRISLHGARQAAAEGDRRTELEERKLYDRHRQALILLDRQLTIATAQKRKNATPPQPSDNEIADSFLRRGLAS